MPNRRLVTTPPNSYILRRGGGLSITRGSSGRGIGIGRGGPRRAAVPSGSGRGCGGVPEGSGVLAAEHRVPEIDGRNRPILFGF